MEIEEGEDCDATNLVAFLDSHEASEASYDRVLGAQL